MNIKQLIEKLQEIDAKYDRDLDVFVVAEPGIVSIFNVLEAEIDADADEDDLITLEEDPEIHVNSVLLEW
jgi:hypothetical protein